jgi:hypothetical protein
MSLLLQRAGELCCGLIVVTVCVVPGEDALAEAAVAAACW